MPLGRRPEPDQDLPELRSDQLARIASAVRRGEALPDPDLAGAAVLQARYLLKTCTGWRGWRLRLTTAAIVLYLLVELLGQLTHVRPYSPPSSATVIALFLLLNHVYILMKFPNIENIRRAERLNLQVAESAGRPIPEAFKIGPASSDERPQLMQSVRRAFLWDAIGVAAAAAATTILLAVDAGPRHIAVMFGSVVAIACAGKAFTDAARAGRRLRDSRAPRVAALVAAALGAWSGLLLGSVA